MSTSRMQELFSDEQFKAKLLSIIQQDGLKAGDKCPTGCGRNLKEKKLNYTDSKSEPWQVIEVPLVVCKCGFQFRIPEGGIKV